jgi:putative RNA 2'-phosphotransferase
MKNLNKLSTELCYYLRHKPENLGITLTSEGYVEVQTFLDALKSHGTDLSLETLQYIVDTDSKGRYGVLQNPHRIRCNQGHSTDQVNLTHKEMTPPNALFHGTAVKNIESILKNGLMPGSRHQVHLSTDINTATSVGSRHGVPVILRVSSKEMANDGFKFMLSDNGVWLTDHVPVKYVTIVSAVELI